MIGERLLLRETSLNRTLRALFGIALFLVAVDHVELLDVAIRAGRPVQMRNGELHDRGKVESHIGVVVGDILQTADGSSVHCVQRGELRQSRAGTGHLPCHVRVMRERIGCCRPSLRCQSGLAIDHLWPENGLAVFVFGEIVGGHLRDGHPRTFLAGRETPSH